ncbi:LOW QUALITY PROTEIN: cytoplasmic dynein 2 heavy chain 1-like [Uloborus diversus]|uniref:LOW QUALITY PROTEIN: cytoplasmic dynein 2 heavy chain 1-like n=1 Tax=Uloborus diversus TaxID=327109 RepID=UPI00240944EE|nr:LOW QUALITY PROTEIN: cytoplasmic dynein 2 heavy chain 1-like [Uloborus diversus]
MSTGDSRKNYILANIRDFFAADASELNLSRLVNAESLESFLDSRNCSVLCAYLDGSEIFVNNKVEPKGSGDRVLVFFKRRPDVVTPDNLLSDVFVSSMVDSPISSLYHALKKVFAPVLLQDERWNRKVDPKLKRLLGHLETSLAASLRSQDASVDDTPDPDALSIIFTPSDEYNYWKEMQGSLPTQDQRARAALFCELMEPFRTLFEPGASFSEMKDALETSFNILDDVWKQDDHSPGFPADRMVNLMDIVGNTMGNFIQTKLQELDLWTGKLSLIEDQFLQSIDLCETWMDLCQKLTVLFWPNYTPHPWKRGVFAPPYLLHFCKRLNEILVLRSVHSQVQDLLTPDEASQMGLSASLKPLLALNPLNCNPYTEVLWEAALAQHDHATAPAKKRVAHKLRGRLGTSQANPLQLIQEFKKYEHLIKQPIIKEELTTERELLLGQLMEYMKTVQKDFMVHSTSAKNDATAGILCSPELINNVTWIRQLDSKIREVSTLSKSMLSDIDGYQNLARDIKAVLNDFQTYNKEKFDTWSQEVMDGLRNRSLGLDTGRPVIFLNERGQPEVSYSPRLVTLMREVRQLRVLGYPIPGKILELEEKAKRHYTQAKTLQQVVNFYKTIADHMILSQQPLMLEAARAFTRVVDEKNAVTWDDAPGLDAHIRKLQQAVERLSRENRMLRKQHFVVNEMVLKLMNTDLLRQQQQWKDVLVDIRSIFVKLQEQGFSSEHMRPWRAHWDRQLYKALEYQYQLGLEVLNEHLPEMKIDLVYRNGSLQFRPPIEEVRAKYYNQMKKFISIPMLFRGVNDVQENLIFPIVMDRNAHSFLELYKKTETLFANLERAKLRFRDWVVLGSVNLADFVSQYCLTAEDWKRNFKHIKAKSQEFSKITIDEEKFDCIVVNYAPTKAYVDYLISELESTMIRCLQRSVSTSVSSVQEFLTEATDTLTRHPQSVEDITQAKTKHQEFLSRREQVLLECKELEAKNEFLGKWSKHSMMDLGNIRVLWETFENTLSDHHDIVERQMEILKASVSSQLKSYQQEEDRFAARWYQFKPKSDLEIEDSEQIRGIISFLKEKRAEFDALYTMNENLWADIRHFNLPEPTFQIEDLKKDLEKTEEVWLLFDEFHNEMQTFAKEEWIVFRSKMHNFESFLHGWVDKIRSKESTADASAVSLKLHQDINDYLDILPLLKYCRGETFSNQHWGELFRLLEMPTVSVEALQLGHFLKVKAAIKRNIEALKALNERAQGEVTLREALNELDLWGAKTRFSLLEHQDSSSNTLVLVKDWKDLLNKVGENQCLLQSLKDTAFYEHFKDRASIWDQRLTLLDRCLHQLNVIQRKWVYLEPIFGRGSLPSERTRFMSICKEFRMVMDSIAQDDRVISLLSIPGLPGVLDTLQDQLMRCQRALNTFLEEKRSAFPRFYFLGDEDLLEILGQSTRAAVIQSHLKKLFAGIHRVQFDEQDATAITAIVSAENEVVPLNRKVSVTSDIEIWLQQLADEMKSTLQSLLMECLRMSRQGAGNSLNPLQYPTQVLCLSEQILFVERCEMAISRNSLSSFLQELQSQLEAYTSMDLFLPSEMSLLKLKLKALVLDIIYDISVVEDLLRDKARSKEDWTWQRRLRFYVSRDGSVVGRMVDAEFEYSYEYQGIAPKLVHTPLTDKCYLTLTQGMHMGMGGNPYGPAGTGKTESVKALGSLFGRQVLVFNCDEGIDVRSMSRIFVGLAKCGTWGCFDEFNRLEESVLSALSVQIQLIQTALKMKTREIELDSKKVNIDFNAGIFITMNPAGKKYGGRQKLPDNLKQLFRPVAMTSPDNDLIAEVILFSEGYKHSKELGRKVVAIFSLARELLSQQQHYDWGLRALKTVLQSCGEQLQSMKKNAGGKKSVEVDAAFESELVVRSLRTNTLSKLTYGDCRRFDALIRDLFPGTAFKSVSYGKLEDALLEACAKMKLVLSENQLKKVLELHEQLQQRMGVVLVGPSGSGKSTLRKILEKALLILGQQVKCYIVNPKSMPKPQLLGYIDLDTREWHDGVLTFSSRQVIKEQDGKMLLSWIVCDGDIDPEWIESLNSVLDDNRLLTMPSGERIRFGSQVNFIFETHDLSCASPATISRMGIIFLSNEDVNVRSLVTAWLQLAEEDSRLILQTFIDDFFYRALDWTLKQNDFVLETSLVGTVMSALSHLKDVKNVPQFSMALARGLGNNLRKPAKEALIREVFSWTGCSLPDPNYPLNTYYDERLGRMDTYHLQEMEDASVHLEDPSSLSVVPTEDCLRMMDSLAPWLSDLQAQPFLLVGPDGCGKSTILRSCLRRLGSIGFSTVSCNAQTGPQHVLQKLGSQCAVIGAQGGRILRPREHERLLLYLKDLCLPRADKWGTSQLLAWLQQVLTYHGYYDENAEWIWIEGIQIVGSVSSTSLAGRTTLNARFTSLMHICAVDYPSQEQLQSIYRRALSPIIMEALPRHQVWSSAAEIRRLVGSMVQLLEAMRNEFSSDVHSHCRFTPVDLTRWVMSLFRHPLSQEGDSTPDAPEGLLRAWAYEAARIFRDRLINQEARNKFEALIFSILRKDWGVSIGNVNDVYYVTGGSLSGDKNGFGRSLEKLTSEEWMLTVEKNINFYSHEVRETEAVVFREVLDSMAQVDRVLSQMGGSLLLVGRSGCGRRLAATVVAHAHQLHVLTPKINVGYAYKQFCNDLKTAMQMSGIEGRDVLFLLEDHQILEDRFLEMVDSLLSSGEVPGLYTPQELEPLVAPLKDAAAQEGFRGSMTNYFAQCVRRRLHVTLVMDFTHPQFQFRCQSNPALYKACSILWLDDWSEESMLQIPRLLISGKEEKYVDTDQDGFYENFYRIHRKSGKNSRSPRKYIAFIQNYRDIFSRKCAEIETRKTHLQAGVSKLEEARSLVDRLNSEAQEQSALLAEKQAEADEALRLITTSMSNTGDQKIELEKLKTKIEEENIKLSKRKKDIDLELKEIEPIVQEAKAAVGNIKSESLSEIRSLRAPPDVIRDILEGVLRLMGIFDTSWVSMKSFLSKRGVKEEILAFDARNISPEIRESVEKLLKKNAESFDSKNAKRASAAAAPLAAWVKANVIYSRVLEKIKPLEKEQGKLKHNLASTEKRITKLSSALVDVEEEVSVLRDRLNKFTKEAAQIEINLKKANETIASAQSLVTKLEDEYSRWTLQLQEIDQQQSELPLKTLLAAAFVTYLCGEPEDKRRSVILSWCKDFGVKRFSLEQVLSSEREQLIWKNEGLPSDALSIENAICILQNSLIPFLIDPSSRATEWLKNHMSNSQLEVVSPHDATFVTSVEMSVRFGKTLLIRDVDAIHPMLFPLLRRDLVNQGPRYVVQIGEKTVDYNMHFKLFLVTKYSEIELPPNFRAVLSTVNFSTTRAGLTGQLLAAVLQKEKPELELRRSELLRREEEMKLQMTQLEESLLQELASARGNILENEELIASLNKTKSSSNELAAGLRESRELQTSLEEERKVYLPLAEFGSCLYFLIRELRKLNNMYCFSLTSFFNLFHSTLEAPMSTRSSGNKIQDLIKTLQNITYESVSRSLFKADRLTFALHLVHGIFPRLFEEQEWEAFTGILLTETKFDPEELKASLPGWLEEDRALSVALLKATFPQLFSVLQLQDSRLWEGFAKSIRCEESFPSSIHSKISLFQQLLCVQALRPDRLQSAAALFASRALGLEELFPQAVKLKNLLSPRNTEPILIILSTGVDPSQELYELASSVVGSENYLQVSMGQGQLEVAIENLRSCASEGRWLCLKNLHLVTHWLPNLLKVFSSLTPSSKFRLWLTSEVHPNFSPVFLEMCIKVTYEAPPGIRRNMMRSYDSWSPSFLSKGGSALRSKTLFVLAWFHALIQERRTLYPAGKCPFCMGWTKFYEFSSADLRVATDVIDRICGSSDQGIMWEHVRGLFETAVYGGRIDDSFDLRVLSSYLKEFFDQKTMTGRKLAGGALVMPTSVDYKEHLQAVRSLPDSDDPELFGLPRNIERSAQCNASRRMIEQLKKLLRPTEIADRFDVRRWNAELSPILVLWKKLNQGSQLIHLQLQGSNDEGGGEDEDTPPVLSFIRQEYRSGVRLLQTVHASLASISKVIRGAILLTDEIHRLATSLLKHETPMAWQRRWEGPEDPLSYLRATVRRATALAQNWLPEAEAGDLLQSGLDLSHLFHPDTFLNALRQQTARECKVSMDNLKFVCNWKGKISQSKISVTITGIYLEGCLFDGHQLSECQHDSAVVSLVPTFAAAWIPKDFPSSYREDEMISMPIYFTSDRERIVTCISLPCGGEQDRWVQSGAALFLKNS